MDSKVMKKMIVLKNLQSNMIEEAYVVFKNNVNVRKFEKVNNQEGKIVTEDKNTNDYMVKEAEMVINDFICNIESKAFSFNNKSLRKSNNWLKVLTFSFAIIAIINFMMFIFK